MLNYEILQHLSSQEIKFGLIIFLHFLNIFFNNLVYNLYVNIVRFQKIHLKNLILL